MMVVLRAKEDAREQQAFQDMVRVTILIID